MPRKRPKPNHHIVRDFAQFPYQLQALKFYNFPLSCFARKCMARKQKSTKKRNYRFCSSFLFSRSPRSIRQPAPHFISTISSGTKAKVIPASKRNAQGGVRASIRG